jgi:Flp pilus assembly protein TadG
MRKLLALRRDQGGAAAIEMAIAVPVLTMFLWGIFQIGVACEAIAGMEHGLGEGARYATLCLNPTSTGTCTIPTHTQITQRINDKVFGTGIGTFTVADPVDGTGYMDLSVTFSMPMNFLFFTGPTISLTQSKRVYVANLS